MRESGISDLCLSCMESSTPLTHWLKRKDGKSRLIVLLLQMTREERMEVEARDDATADTQRDRQAHALRSSLHRHRRPPASKQRDMERKGGKERVRREIEKSLITMPHSYG